MSDVKAFFDGLSAKVDSSKIAGMDVVYQFNLGDEVYSVAIANDAAAVTEGAAENATIELTMSQEDFMDMVNGDLNGQMAFLSGKLKIRGDMALALKLQSIFNIGG
jgi:putative sterol carrier protein